MKETVLALFFAVGLAIAIGYGCATHPLASAEDSGWRVAHVDPRWDGGR
jgi:hypothetical protein